MELLKRLTKGVYFGIGLPLIILGFYFTVWSLGAIFYWSIDPWFFGKEAFSMYFAIARTGFIIGFLIGFIFGEEWKE